MSGLTEGRTAADVFVSLLRLLLSDGSAVAVRGHDVLEVCQHAAVIRAPRCRFYVVPGRLNSVVHTLAETIWVLAGRDDLEFLARYLPRAPEFSDDGLTWRGAYGPRLRNWHSVDQLAEVVRVLREDRESRRAAMVIFDPQRDHAESLDIPCTNWLHFIVRGNLLHLTVGIRSNDVMWGFSGINSFEWSVVQEVVANSLPHVIPGELTFMAGSLHIYKRHLEQARDIIALNHGESIYSLGVEPTSLTLSVDTLDASLGEFFVREQAIRDGQWKALIHEPMADPFLQGGLCLLAAFYLAQLDPRHPGITECVREMPKTDVRVAAAEYLGRRFNRPDLLGMLEVDVSAFLRPCPE